MRVLRQLDVLEYMRGYQLEHQMPTTIREIAAHFGFKSTHTVTCHFALLAKKGLVHHRPGIARGCRALPEVQP